VSNNHADLIIEHFTAIIEEVGEDFVYVPPGGLLCMYVWEYKPSCVIGKILHRLGVPLSELSGCEYQSVIRIPSILEDSPSIAALGFTIRDWEFLRLIQVRQDEEERYGDILEFARDYNMNHMS
jgi:hypothetical protein